MANGLYSGESTEVLILETDSRIVLWSVINASLGAYIAFSLTIVTYGSHTRRSSIFQVFRLLGAALSLNSGFWACLSAESTLRSNSGGLTQTSFFQPSSFALSFCLPLFLIISALTIFGLREGRRLWACFACGLLLGLSVILMNYAAYFASPEFTSQASPASITISSLLYVNGSVLWFLVISLARDRFKFAAPLWIPVLASLVLGCTATGARYLGRAGMSFSTIQSSASIHRAAGIRKVVTLGIPSFITLLLLGSITAIAIYRKPHAIERRRPNIFLASVSVAGDGRILVNEDDTLPCQRVCLDGLPNDVVDELDIQLDTFHWLLTLSLNWNILEPSLPSIISTSGSAAGVRPSLRRCLRSWSLKPKHPAQISSRQMLKLRLLEAAAQLAKRVGMPPQDLGYLDVSVLETGTQLAVAALPLLPKHASAESQNDEEALKGEESSGRMLFFVRELPDRPKSLPALSPAAAPAAPPEVLADTMSRGGVDGTNWPHKLAVSGYKLRALRRVRDSLTDKTGARQSDIGRILGGCRDHISTASRPILDAGAIYVSIYSEHYKEDGSAEVLVYDFAKHQIPAWRLDVRRLNTQMRDWVRLRAGTTASRLYDMCKDCSSDQSGHPSMIGFLDALGSALERLMDDLAFLGFETISKARLDPQVIEIPAASGDGEMAHMIILNACANEEHDIDSDTTHVSSAKSGLRSSEQPNFARMPSVFAYTPRALFDVLHALVCSPRARDAICLQVAGEVKQLLAERPTSKKDKIKNRVSKRSSRGDEGPYQFHRGRLPPELVSSFSIDTLTEDGDGLDNRCNSTPLIARVYGKWEVFKSQTRSLAPRLRRLSLSRAVVRRESSSTAASSVTLTDVDLSSSPPLPTPPLPTYAAALAARSAVELNPPTGAGAFDAHVDSPPHLKKRPSMGRSRSATASGSLELSSRTDAPKDAPPEYTKRHAMIDVGRSKLAMATSAHEQSAVPVVAAVAASPSNLANRLDTTPVAQMGRSRSAVASAPLPAQSPLPRRSLPPIPPLSWQSLPPIPPSPRSLPPLPPLRAKIQREQGRQSGTIGGNATKSVPALRDLRR